MESNERSKEDCKCNDCHLGVGGEMHGSLSLSRSMGAPYRRLPGLARRPLSFGVVESQKSMRAHQIARI